MPMPAEIAAVCAQRVLCSIALKQLAGADGCLFVRFKLHLARLAAALFHSAASMSATTLEMQLSS